MDTSKAEAHPGVRAILRFDHPEIEGKVLPGSYGAPWLVLPDTGRWEGEPVGAVVAADSEQICEEALSVIEIEWEQLPFVLEEEEALRANAPKVSIPELDIESHGFRLVREHIFKQGDIDQGLKEGAKVIEFKVRRRYHTWAGAEMTSAVCRWNGDYAELWVNHQHVYEHKKGMSAWFGIPMNRITVHAPYQGGSFGGWSWMNWSPLIHYLTALLSRMTRRPVKMLFNRRDNFYGGSLDAGVYHLKVGAKEDGTITAVRMENVFVNSPRGYQPDAGMVHFVENTSIPNLHLENRGVLVNRGPTNAVRSEQLPNTLCINLAMSHVAAALGLDPTEVALKNDGFRGRGRSYLSEYKRMHGLPDRDSLKACIEAGKKRIDWDKKWHLPGTKRLSNGRMHGMGFIWTHEWNSKRGAGFGAIQIHTDGSASILGLRSDIGVCAETAYSQIVAEEMGMRYEDVVHRQQNDTGFVLMTPDGACNLTANGSILRKAARKAKRRLLELATQPIQPYRTGSPIDLFVGFRPEELDVEESIIYVKADPSRKIPIKEIVNEHQCIQFTTHPPVIEWAWHSQRLEQGQYEERPRLCRQAHFMEVEVDTETGEIEITRVVNVNDVGKAVNPEAVEGQQYGGMYMAAGRSLLEEVILDQPTGVMVNGNLLDYKIATMLDCGPIEAIIVETGMGYGPYGAEGIGEDVADHASTLLGPAVHNALGVWIDDYPITPDKVLKALGKV